MRESVVGRWDSGRVEILGWPVVEDANLVLDVARPFQTAADGDVIMACQPLADGRIGMFMVRAEK